MRTKKHTYLLPKVVGSTPAGCNKSLISSGLRKRGSTAVARLAVLALLPMPYFAFLIPRHWFQWVLLFLALACMAAAICKVFRWRRSARQNAARMADWWARRSARWTEGGRK